MCVVMTVTCHVVPQLLMMVGLIDSPIKAASSSPIFPSIMSVGPTNTPLAHDVTEPPAITSQPPEVSIDQQAVLLRAYQSMHTSTFSLAVDCYIFKVHECWLQYQH